MKRLGDSISQGVDQQVLVHNKTLDQHFIVILLGVGINKRVFTVDFVPTFDSYLICDEKSPKSEEETNITTLGFIGGGNEQTVELEYRWMKKERNQNRLGFRRR